MKRSLLYFLIVIPLCGRMDVVMTQTVNVSPGQLPTGGVVSGGAVKLQSSGTTLWVNQSSSRGVVDWSTFNIGSQAKVEFVQPSSSAVTLNRVMDVNPSQILGKLSATGQVFISNPNGIIFGTTSRVDVGGLVASTQRIGVADFMAGNQRLVANTPGGTIVNQGLLQSSLGGYIALMAPQVRNEGVIVAREGTVALAAGTQTTLEFMGSRLVSVMVDQPALNALIENKQLIRAEGGFVVMSARSASSLMRTVVNNTGVVQAPTLVKKQGRILLDGGESGLVQVGGRLDASATQPGDKGGSIIATGERVEVAVDAKLDASGSAGGGSIGVGGSWQGQDASVRNAKAVIVKSGAVLDASATVSGDGGDVVVYSDTQQEGGLTRVAGTLLARGGPQGGNGGRIETSGHWLSTTGATGDAGSPAGQAGQWLFDPYNVTIVNSSTQNNLESAGIWTPGNTPSEIQNSSINTLLNSGTHVTVSTGGTGSAGGEAGNIIINAPIEQNISAPAARLTMTAQQDITVNQPISLPRSGSKLELISGNSVIGGNVMINAAINADTLSFSMSGPNSTITQTAPLGTNNLRLSGGQTAVTLDNSSNNVGIVAANLKSLVLKSNDGIDQGSVYGKGTYVGTVDGLSGVTASGVIQIAANGNLFLTQSLASSNTSSDAIQLNAGAALSPGSYDGTDQAINPYGPNVILTSGKTIITGAGGRSTIYMGSTSNSGAALADYAIKVSPAGSPRFRYNSDESTSNFSPLTATNTGMYVVLRQNPTLTVKSNNASTVYGSALNPSTGVTVSGFLNGDSLTQAVSTGATNSIAGPTSSSGYLTAGPHLLTPFGAAGLLGYGFDYVSGTLTVTPKPMTITASLTATSKVYDGSTAAITSLSTTDRVGVDSVTLGSVSSTYNNKNVGVGKAVTVNGLYIGGADAANYSLISTVANTTGGITKKDLAATFIANSKTYDGTATASANGSSTDIVVGDVVAVTGTGLFNNKNVGEQKSVIINAGSLSGTDAGNYNLLSPTGAWSADIAAKPITPVYTASNKSYDGSTTATVSASNSQFVPGDSVALVNTSSNFSDKHVGTGKTVTISGIALSGSGMGNYTLVNSTATATANITAIPLTVSGISVADKIYDGNTSATVNTSGAVFAGLLAGDVVQVSSTGVFSNKNAQSNKLVSLSSNYSGSDVGNYNITSQPSATASITPRSLAVSASVNNKIYDGTRSASFSLSSDNIAGDSLTLSADSALFSDKNAGTGKAVTVGGITLGGVDASNYNLQNASTVARADITPKPITATGFTASNKVYDATDVAILNVSAAKLTVGAVSDFDNKLYAGDNVQLNTATAAGSFVAGKNVGLAKQVVANGLALTGSDALNYTISDASMARADITAAPMSVTGITASSKVYDGNTSVSVSTAGVQKHGLLGTDIVTVSASGQFVNKNAGVDREVKLASVYGGADADNYLITSQSSATASIFPRDLVVKATASNKIYDSTSKATFSLSSNALQGDSLILTATSGSFDDKNVGVGKIVSVSGISVSGLDDGNYSLQNSVATTTANITPKPVTASGILAFDKIYDTSDSVRLNVTKAALTSGGITPLDSKIYAGDDVRLNASGASGVFTGGKDVGVDKSVSIKGLNLSGGDAGNYLVTDASAARATINPKWVSILGISASDKTFDSTSSVTLNTSRASIQFGAQSTFDNKVYDGDDVRLNASNAKGVFVLDTNVGLDKPIRVSGLSLSGKDGRNYLAIDGSNTKSSVKLWEGLTSCSLGGGCPLEPLMRVSMIAPQFSANLVQPSANRSLPNMVGEVLPVIPDSLPRGQPVNLTTVRHLLPQTVSTLTPRQLMEVMPFLNASQWMAISSNQVSGLPESLRAQVLLRQGRSREVMQMSNMQISLLPLTTVAANLRLFSYDQLLSLTSQQVQALSPLQQTERLEMIRKALR